MRPLLVLASLALATLLSTSAAGAGTPTAAVMPLGKGAGGPEFDGLGRSLADMMVTDLSESKALQLVERTQLGLVLDELALAKSGYLDERTAQKLGRGLGAQLVITGSFSVIDSTFVMDCRIIVVESGAILKAARSQGPVDDFIAIEKDVVEKLLSGLKVTLSPGARRKLLVASPTESVKALASYGRGVEASEAGQIESAQRAFAEALKQDPDFAKASLALRDLASLTEAARSKERARYESDKQRGLRAALLALPAETSRAKKFHDTRASLLDFAIRQYLLGRDGQHCQRYLELKHFLLRKQGDFSPWYDGLGSNHQSSYRAGSEMMDERARQLGIMGPRTFMGTRPGELIFATSGLSSGPQLLLYRSMSPEKFDGTLLAVMAQCHPPAVQIAELESLIQHARTWSWIDQPLYRVHNVGPATVTGRDSLDLYWAYLRALHRGVSPRVRARTDAVLARHPEGDSDRGQVLSRIREVVQAGETHERRVAARMRFSDEDIVKKARAMLQGDKRQLHLDHGTCKALRELSTPRLTSAWERYESDRNATRQDTRASALDRLGLAIGPFESVGCFRRGKAVPLAPEKILTMVESGLGRPHPARLEDESCLRQSKSLKDSLSRAGNAQSRPGTTIIAPDALHHLLSQLQSLRYQRCLVP